MDGWMRKMGIQHCTSHHCTTSKQAILLPHDSIVKEEDDYDDENGRRTTIEEADKEEGKRKSTAHLDTRSSSDISLDLEIDVRIKVLGRSKAKDIIITGNRAHACSEVVEQLTERSTQLLLLLELRLHQNRLIDRRETVAQN